MRKAPTQVWINHRHMAVAMGIQTQLLLRMIDRGEIPPPISIKGVTRFYKRRDFNRYLKTGTWPRKESDASKEGEANA